jgi:hypothetical protein
MSDFKKLNVWKKAHALALNTHRVAGRMRGTANGSSRDIEVISKTDFLTLLNDVIEVRKMLHGLLAKLPQAPQRLSSNRTVPS